MDGRFYTRLARVERVLYGGRKRPAAMAGVVIAGSVAKLSDGRRVEEITRLRGESAADFRARLQGIASLRAEKVTIMTRKEFESAMKRALESV